MKKHVTNNRSVLQSIFRINGNQCIGILVAILWAILPSCKDDGSLEQMSEQLTFTYKETDEAFPNPMKGFRSDFNQFQVVYDKCEYGRVYKKFFAYNDIEPDASYGVKRIEDRTNYYLKGIENSNIKIVPRVEMSARNNLEFWPTDISQPDYVSRWYTEELKLRMVAMIYKLGQAWDNDPRIAFVELGLWGYWGEHHIYPDGSSMPEGSNIPTNFQEALGNAAIAAFKNKKVMIRYPIKFTNFNFGCFWDSFALPNDKTSNDGIIAKDNWRTQVNLGEISYTWGDNSLLGKSINETIASDKFTDNVLTYIENTHTSVLGWNVGSPTFSTDKISVNNAARLQKKLGYRFVINEASFPNKLNTEEKATIKFKVSNIGVAPFYYPWPVELSLLDDNHNPVFSVQPEEDIRTWLPGETHEISLDLAIGSDIPAGTYTLALAVLDTGGNLPALRFANENYYKGGRTPLGKIGVNTFPVSEKLDPFDSLHDDKSIVYKVE